MTFYAPLAEGRTSIDLQGGVGLAKAGFVSKGIPPVRIIKRPAETEESISCHEEHEDTPPREGTASREETASAPSTPVKHAHSKLEPPPTRVSAASPTPGKKRVVPQQGKIPVKSAVKSKIPKPQ